MMTDPAMIAPAVMKPTKPYGYEKPDMTAAVMTINAVQIVVTAATNIDADIMLFMIVPFRRGNAPAVGLRLSNLVCSLEDTSGADRIDLIRPDILTIFTNE